MAEKEKELLESESSSVTKPIAEDITSLKQALEEEIAKAERYLANWQRAQADLINYKKRVEQERNEVASLIISGFLLNILSILDDLERALKSVPHRLLHLTWVDGIRLIHRKFQSILEAQGLSEIKAQGQPFDPRYHEAVAYEEGKEGIVIEELQKGYMFKERVLRPALVIVGEGETKEKEEKTEAFSG